VRQQLDDLVELLTETPERTKAMLPRLGVSFALHPDNQWVLGRT
jgi:hypothetical protein